MKSKTILPMIIVLILATAIFAAGCDTSSIPFIGGKKGQDIDASNIFKGTKGMTISFQKDSPPSSISSGTERLSDPIEIALLINNLGASDITESYVLLNADKEYFKMTGWDESDNKNILQIGASGNKITVDIEGKSEYYPMGGSIIAVANAEIIPLPKEKKEAVTDLKVTACYKYETTATAQICMDPDKNNQRNLKKTCEIKTVSLPGGQGGPVGVTHIEEVMDYGAGKDIMLPALLITIKNFGGAGETVIDKDSIAAACGSETAMLNVVTVRDVEIAGIRKSDGLIKCDDKVILGTDGSVKFKCSIIEEQLNPAEREFLSRDQGTFESSARVWLEYGYRFSTSKRVTITNPEYSVPQETKI